MSKKQNNVVVEETKVEKIEGTDVETVKEESKFKKFANKAKDFTKKNWKKAAGVAAIAGATLVGYALGAKSKEDYDGEVIDAEYDEYDDSSNNEDVVDEVEC